MAPATASTSDQTPKSTWVRDASRGPRRMRMIPSDPPNSAAEVDEIRANQQWEAANCPVHRR
jgi:hypothetical protein